jgi:predicted AlkP superfamily phosphohydrolase/phosphomutase
MAPTKVLFLEIDAGDEELIRRWAADGTLPALRDLFARGLTGDTIAPEGFFVGAIWPSLYTATNPARHGIHSLCQLRSGSYEFFRATTGEHIKRKPFWDHLCEAGRRVAVLDVPLSGLSKSINGIQSVEWGAHDAIYGFRAWPPSFEAEVRERFGTHPVDRSCNDYGRTPAEFAALRDLLVEGARRKGELTRHYLGQGGWDFFGQVFTESHCVGHQCWHLHDPSHPGHDPELAAAIGDPIRDVYAAIDAEIGKTLAQVGDDTTVIVLAGHGMLHKRGAQFLLPEVLARLGVAVLAPPRPPEPVERLDAALGGVWQRTPAPVRRALSGARARVRAWIDDRAGPSSGWVGRIDPANSRCFLLDNGFPISGLRLNLVGREPAGLLRGDEADGFCRQLSEDLLALEDADSGVRLVHSVKRTRDLCAGEHLDDLPDLIVEWSTEHRLGSASCGNPAGSHVRVRSSRIGVVEGTNGYVRTGDHRPQGLFVATGPGIQPGGLPDRISIMDFAPTFCALLGVAMPEVDGRPIAKLLEGSRVGDETA